MSRLKSELNKNLKEAKESESYMVAVWKIEDNRVHLYRMSENFPFIEFDSAIRLLRDDLSRLVKEDLDRLLKKREDDDKQ